MSVIYSDSESPNLDAENPPHAGAISGFGNSSTFRIVALDPSECKSAARREAPQ